MTYGRILLQVLKLLALYVAAAVCLPEKIERHSDQREDG